MVSAWEHALIEEEPVQIRRTCQSRSIAALFVSSTHIDMDSANSSIKEGSAFAKDSSFEDHHCQKEFDTGDGGFFDEPDSMFGINMPDSAEENDESEKSPKRE